jgi:hypothetical protein
MKASLAVDRMSSQALWRIVLEELYWLDPQAGPSVAGHSRELSWQRMRVCIRELHMRGVQMALPLGKGEEVARD